MEWENIGYDVYKEIMGEEEFNKRVDQDSKIPPRSIFDGIQLAYHRKRITLLFGAVALFTNKRPTHPIGVGAQGVARIVTNPQFPKCDFFTPGMSFPVCLRHSTLQAVDDAGVNFVGAAIKFSGSDDHSPFDLVLSTGRSSALWNVQTIYDALDLNSTGKVKEFYLQSPDHLASNIDGLRRSPDSFYDQRYYSGAILDFAAFDGLKRYVRFRMIPADGSPETGLLTKEEQKRAWKKRRLPSETRDRNYLKTLFIEQLSKKGVLQYKLQLALHVPGADDPPDILHIGRYWDESSHPWLDLADVTITTPLAPKVTECLQFNAGNLPPSLSLLPAHSIHDYSCVMHIRKDVYSWTQKMRSMISSKLEPKQTATYIIQVETGSQSGSGTDANIFISLTGTKGKTKLIPLRTWRTDFETGSTNDFSVEAMDVGQILMIHLHNDRGGWRFGKPDWFVNKILVISSKLQGISQFPCFRWVLSDMTVFQGKGLLPFQDQPEAMRNHRALELQKRREDYKWGNQPGLKDLPGFIDAPQHDDIPKDSQFSDEATRSFYRGSLRGAANLGLCYLYTLWGSWDDFDHFKKLFTGWVSDVPKIAQDNRWMDDTMFGYQYLNGCHPVVITRCEEMPSNFPVTDDLVKTFLDRRMTLTEEIEAGHVYIADYSVLVGIKRNGEGVNSNLCYLAEPIALFYVKSSGKLVPIAIQLFQQPSDINPIWTPNDSHFDWLLAKMWLGNADHQVHQMATHLLKTHLLMEAFAVGAWRQLASNHPIFQLLFPHLRSVMAINTIGRNELINEGGIADKTLSTGGGGHIQLLQKVYKSFKLGMLSFPDQLRERGVDDPEKLPSYYYRDDGLRLWNAINVFILKVVNTFYKSDSDVLKDNELQSWILDLHENGFPVRNGDVHHEFPKSLQTRDQLVQLLTCVVFTCSCQHAAVNFGQMESTAFIPNKPSVMRRPPPTNKNEATLNSIMDTLPNKWQAGWHIATMYTLTRFAQDERFLGDYSQSPLTDEAVEGAISSFQASLQKISQDIHKRNASLEFPYNYLLPERVPNSIAI